MANGAFGSSGHAGHQREDGRAAIQQGADKAGQVFLGKGARIERHDGRTVLRDGQAKGELLGHPWACARGMVGGEGLEPPTISV